MSRPIVLGIAALLLFAFGVIAANTRIVQGVIPVTPYEADVNKDGRVNVADLGNVAVRYGQVVPTATPTADLQPHEARVVLPVRIDAASCRNAIAPCDWLALELGPSRSVFTGFDAANYPAGAESRLVVTAAAASESNVACFRLSQQDSTASGVTGTPIAGSETCEMQPVGYPPLLFESAPMSLPTGHHFYQIEFRSDGPPATSSYINVEKVEIVIRWFE